MEHILWFVIMIPCSALFTCIGIFAMKRKKPMWFWSGTTVKETEISDIPAYNKANGFMWIGYSLVFWFSTFLGLWNEPIASIVLTAGTLGGLPILIIVYNRIYRKYRVRN